HKAIRYKVVGAPKNLFDTAAQKVTVVSTKPTAESADTETKNKENTDSVSSDEDIPSTSREEVQSFVSDARDPELEISIEKREDYSQDVFISTIEKFVSDLKEKCHLLLSSSKESLTCEENVLKQMSEKSVEEESSIVTNYPAERIGTSVHMPDTNIECANRSNNTQADIQEVVQSEISKYLMSSDFKELLRDSFKEALSGMIAQVVKPFEEKIIKLKEKVLQLEEKCNENEQYSRRYNVRIYGVNNSTSADSYGDGARALIVKFKSYESKRKVMINKRKLKGRKLYVNEDLTWMNQQLLKRVRDAIAGKAYVFTADGYILVKVKPDCPPVRIRRDSDLLRYDFE
ncbi:Hypothetical predicted protein, partial [Paramuricea clavata]